MGLVRSPQIWTILQIIILNCACCYCFDPAQGPLGMDSDEIEDNQLSASSALANHEAQVGRLYYEGSFTAWCSAVPDENQWFEVAFGETVTLTAISTQGREEANEWTETYRLSYKTYDFWQFYTDANGIVKIFNGNTDSSTVVVSTLTQPVEAKRVRIHPVKFNGNMCLRVELHGYRMGQLRPLTSKLGIESGAILDSQLTASSMYEDNTHIYSPDRSRLSSAGDMTPGEGWCANGTSQGEWLQADLRRPILVTAISLQVVKLVDSSEKAYLMTVTIEYSNDGVNFESAKDKNGNSSYFDGNKEFVDELKTIELPVPVFARYVRITVWDFVERVCTRWDLHGYRIDDMGEALGMENSVIKDTEITASSSLANSSPARARLNAIAADGMSAWCSALDDDAQWLQVDLRRPTRVTAITVQGRGDAGVDEFVKGFTVSYGHDGYSWFGYNTPSGDLKYFQGSYDGTTPVTSPLLHSVISARYIRLHPVVWGTAICMRVEIHGFRNSGHTTVRYDGFGVAFTANPASAVTLLSSSDFDASHTANQGRLSNPNSSWRPSDGDTSPWLQVDLGEVSIVTGVVTEGSVAEIQAQWITGYRIQYREDSQGWDSYDTPLNLTSNYDNETQIAVMLTEPIRAQYVRILPISYLGAVSLRLEMLGYPVEPLTTTTQKVTTLETLSVDARLQMIENAHTISEVYEAVVYNNIIIGEVNQAALNKLPEMVYGKENWSLNEVEDIMATLRACRETAGLSGANRESFFEMMDRVLGVDINKLSEDENLLNHVASDVMVSMESYATDISSNMATGQKNETKTGHNLELRVETVTAEDIDLETKSLIFFDEVRENSIKLLLTGDQLTANNGFPPDEIKISTIKYRNLHRYIGTDMEEDDVNDSQRWETTVISHVISYLIIGDVVDSDYVNREHPVYLTFKNTEDTPEDHADLCVFWKFDERSTNGVWATTGCDVDGRTETDTTCRCDHLTNFAVLMRFTPNKVISHGNSMALELLTYIGTISSIICLLFAVLVYAYLRLLKIQRIVIHANLSISLAIAQLVYISGIQATFNEGLCTTIAVLLHYFFLVSFMWMLLEGVQLYTKSVHVFATGIRTWVFMVAGWGIPVVVVSISLPVRYEGYGSVDRCWLSLDHGLIWAFLAPVLVVISVNVFVLIMVIRVFMTLKANADKTEKERLKAGLRAVLMLQPLLGMTWLFGLLSSYDPSLLFNYLFVIFNSLQGVFIFLLHCLMNDEVRKTFRIQQKKMKSSVMSSSGTETSVITKQTKLKPDYKSDLAKICVEEKKRTAIGKEAWSES